VWSAVRAGDLGFQQEMDRVLVRLRDVRGRKREGRGGGGERDETVRDRQTHEMAWGVRDRQTSQ